MSEDTMEVEEEEDLEIIEMLEDLAGDLITAQGTQNQKMVILQTILVLDQEEAIIMMRMMMKILDLLNPRRLRFQKKWQEQ